MHRVTKVPELTVSALVSHHRRTLEVDGVSLILPFWRRWCCHSDVYPLPCWASLCLWDCLLLAAEWGQLFSVYFHTNSRLWGCSIPPISSIMQSFHIQYLQPLALVSSPLPHFYHVQSQSSNVSISQSPLNVFHILHVLVASAQPSQLSAHCPQTILFHHPRTFTTLFSPVFLLLKDPFNLNIIAHNHSYQWP